MKAQEEEATMQNHGVPHQPQNTIIIARLCCTLCHHAICEIQEGRQENSNNQPKSSQNNGRSNNDNGRGNNEWLGFAPSTEDIKSNPLDNHMHLTMAVQ
jgi:hypothetical protein